MDPNQPGHVKFLLILKSVGKPKPVLIHFSNQEHMRGLLIVVSLILAHLCVGAQMRYDSRCVEIDHERLDLNVDVFAKFVDPANNILVASINSASITASLNFCQTQPQTAMESIISMRRQQS